MPRPDDCDDRDPSIGAARRGWIDADGDGYGSDVATERCPAEGELANASGDCDDAEAKISPAAVEVCNGRDDDCDGEIDDGIDVPTWYRDADGDGYGAQPDTALAQCDQPVGYADNVADCDDSDWAVNPATEWQPLVVDHGE